MPPDVSKLLWDMRHAVTRVGRFTADKSYDDYVKDDLLRSGVERQFEIIGEAMSRLIKLDAAVAARITDHRKITAFRNALVHGYDSVDEVIAWGIVQNHQPLLCRELEALLGA